MADIITISNTPEHFSFHKDGKPTIIYDKQTKTTKEEQQQPSSSNTNQSTFKVHCIVGYIEGYTNNFLIAGSEVTKVANILSYPIYKIDKFMYIPERFNHHSEKDDTCLTMLDDFLKRNALYYSNKIDLTLSFKAYKTQYLDKQKKFDSYVFTSSVKHFCWNYAISKELDQKLMRDYIYPIINGFVGIQQANEYNNKTYVVVLGRKDVRRSGMRFHIRGADSNGNVANYVETETVLFNVDKDNKQNILSFCQVRGSIPLLWTQEPNLQLNPKIQPKNNFDENVEVFKAHIDEMRNEYESVMLVNLIDKKKDQEIIGKYFEKLSCNYKEKHQDANVHYKWFDFHSECKNMQYQNLSKLLTQVKITELLTSFGYTHIVCDESTLNNKTELKLHEVFDKSNFKQIQHGVFRTNCIDCLDRTNVVQSVFARCFLHKMLFDCGIGEKPTNEPFQSFKEGFEYKYKTVWADHGDGISRAYSGTNALKADFVRTGQRTLQGTLVDGLLSSTRFVINNFRDGYNQDCHDYFLKALRPNKQPFKQHSLSNVITPIVCFVLLGFILYYFLKEMTYGKRDSSGKCLYKFVLFVGSFTLSIRILLTTFKKSLIDLHTRHS